MVQLLTYLVTVTRQHSTFIIWTLVKHPNLKNLSFLFILKHQNQSGRSVMMTASTSSYMKDKISIFDKCQKKYQNGGYFTAVQTDMSLIFDGAWLKKKIYVGLRVSKILLLGR